MPSLLSDDPEVRRLELVLLSLNAELRVYPDRAATHASKAGVLSNLNRVEEACAALALAEQYGASHGYFHLIKGVLTVERGDLSDARLSFERALQLEPDNPDFHHQYGLFLLAAGEFGHGLYQHEWRLKDRAYLRREGLPEWLADRPIGDFRA